ncbi:head-tail connector protein [Gymnodinialimonas ceratoperidinii]|uniref:PhiE125 gp8 family phage protein n=1 Tax=Gymnodinialimonas ceratoperidinii TaxID=2856823 RepID=A0A8F6Y9F1_9RHOB|nr:hypothetical protein [Gymnodinialimonas ceratoperidinii]QXT38889.1 hypothetical protein KYE46_13225 [Gymnodinialimonas ceratoperidinii]
MMMVELTSVPSAALPVEALSEHLRLSSGFADDGSQDAQLEDCLRSAMAAIEARIGKVLMQRQFALTLVVWHNPASHGLPVAPVSSVDSVTLIARGGEETLVDPARYTLLPDAHRPSLDATSGALPTPTPGGTIEVVLTAGYGAAWPSVPADLQRALLALAAEFYTLGAAAPRQMPAAVMSLIEPYRQIRLRGGVA